MKNGEYWARRFKALEDSNHKKAVLTAKQVEDIYKSAEMELQAKVATWYARLAKNNDISIFEAKRLMKGQELEEFRWDVEQYIKAMHENEYDPKWAKQLENASARFHISKYEGLQIRLKQYTELVAAKQQNLMTEYLKNVYSEDYYKVAYEIQLGFNTGFELSAINENQLDNVLKRPWATDGKNFSDRIWNNKEKLYQQLDTEITRNLMLGYNPSKSAEVIAKKFKTSVHNATTLVYTETAAISSMATENCFKGLNVERYEIVATLDSSTSVICQEMDGKVFEMKDFKVGVTAPPFHPRCRSVEAPYFDDEYSDLFNDGEVRVARNPETGKTEYVPADMKYKEWKERFVDNDQFTSESNGGIIKSIDIDDFELFAQSEYNNILQEVSDVIINTIREFEKQGRMYISEAHFGEFYDRETGKPALFQIFQNAYGLTELNVNSKILGGRTLDEINNLIKNTPVNIANTLQEAVIHECGHAKAYYKKSAKEVTEMNRTIKNKGVKGISRIAEEDGAECIAEVEVLLYRGEQVSQEALNLYNKWVGG